MKLTDKLSVSGDVVAREVGGETILLDLASGTYIGLNTVGARIWNLIEEVDGVSLAEVCDKLLEEFDAQRYVVELDVLNLSGKLLELDLVTVRNTLR